jgi:hypothetical protein
MTTDGQCREQLERHNVTLVHVSNAVDLSLRPAAKRGEHVISATDP